jgi:hypothetical protein
MKTQCKPFKSLQLFSFVIILSFLYSSCSPSIKYFEITDSTNTVTRTITSDDSLLIKWKVCGEPTLLFHELAFNDSSNIQAIHSGVKYFEYTLVVKKCKKEVRKIIQVNVIPKESVDSITFMATFNANHDSLIAKGIKNPIRWGDKFKILTLVSGSHRMIKVNHAGISATINKEGLPSNAFEGIPIEGNWDLRSPLSEEEKRNPSLLPEFLKIKIRIKYKRT